MVRSIYQYTHTLVDYNAATSGVYTWRQGARPRHRDHYIRGEAKYRGAGSSTLSDVIILLCYNSINALIMI